MLRRFPRFAVFAILPLALFLGVFVSSFTSHKIARGVHLSGVPIGGLTIEQAENLIVESMEAVTDTVTFSYGEKTYNSSFENLGVVCDVKSSVAEAYKVGKEGNLYQRFSEVLDVWINGQNLPLIYEFNKKNLDNFLQTVAKDIDKAPVNARLALDDNKSMKVIEHQPGLELDAVKSAETARKNINKGIFDIPLVVETIQPSVFTSDFEGINGVIGTYKTTFRPWERSRTHNVKLAAQAVNGTIIKPGQIFSFNEIVGERTKARGYQDARMFIEGRIEEGLGGGVCQVTTTLYNVALLANLKIARRLPHSRPVDYAPVGRDATVAFPVVDFKFENNTEAPIYVASSVGENTLNITIMGKVIEGRKVEIVASNHQVIKAPVVTKAEDKIEAGKTVVRAEGRSGHRITIHRIVKQGDEILSRELISNDSYRPENRIIATSSQVSDN